MQLRRCCWAVLFTPGLWLTLIRRAVARVVARIARMAKAAKEAAGAGCLRLVVRAWGTWAAVAIMTTVAIAESLQQELPVARAVAKGEDGGVKMGAKVRQRSRRS